MTEPPAFRGDDIHVWRVPLDAPDVSMSAFEPTLSDDERRRADRFRLPYDRRRFVVARGALRTLLGRYLDRAPGALTFLYGPQGKPSLLPSPGVPSLHFNLSHSADTALIAVRQQDAVGIDIEQIRFSCSWRPIARRFFCDAEIDWLHALPSAEQPEGFFILWTRKEAFLKAQGEGLWHDLRRFDVSQSPVLENGQSLDWRLHDINPGTECKAALALCGSLPPIKTWEWRPL